MATVSGQQQTLLPNITQHPVGGIFAQDSTVELNCEASSGHGDETPPTYQWVRDNEDVANSGNSLVIQSLNVETSGSYACLATFNLETVISAAAEVQLISKSLLLIISRAKMKKKLKEGFYMMYMYIR